MTQEQADKAMDALTGIFTPIEIAAIIAAGLTVQEQQRALHKAGKGAVALDSALEKLHAIIRKD